MTVIKNKFTVHGYDQITMHENIIIHLTFHGLVSLCMVPTTVTGRVLPKRRTKPELLVPFARRRFKRIGLLACMCSLFLTNKLFKILNLPESRRIGFAINSEKEWLNGTLTLTRDELPGIPVLSYCIF